MLCFKIDLKVYLGIPFSYLSYNQNCDGLDECEDKNLTQGCHFHFLGDLPTSGIFVNSSPLKHVFSILSSAPKYFLVDLLTVAFSSIHLL